MRIRKAHLEVLWVPFAETVVTAAHRWDGRQIGLVRLVCDDDLEGIGEVSTERPEGITGSTHSLDGLLGLDPTDEAALEPRLHQLDDMPGMGRALRSAVESAVVDLLARSRGLSIASWLRADHDADVLVNGLVALEGPAQAATDAAGLVAAGLRCLKVKGGGESLSATVQRIEAVRAAVGPGVGLRLDLNGSLAPEPAAALLEALASFDLEYVEQPIGVGHGPAAMATLRRGSPVAIAADESIDGLQAARESIAADAVDVIVVKPARVGGLRSARQIVDLAESAGIATTVSTLFETGVGIAGSLQLAATVPGRRAHGLGTAGLLASDLLREPLRLTDGRMALPLEPGLGVEVDRSKLDGLRAS